MVAAAMFRRSIPPFCICICIQWWQEQCWEGQSPLLSFLYFCLRDNRRKAPEASSFSRNPVSTSNYTCKSYKDHLQWCHNYTKTMLVIHSNIKFMRVCNCDIIFLWSTHLFNFVTDITWLLNSLILLTNIDLRCFVARQFLSQIC